MMLATGAAMAQPVAVDPSATPEWTIYRHSRVGASYCPLLDTHAGNTLCLNIGCAPGRQLALDVVLNGRVGDVVASGQPRLVAQIATDDGTDLGILVALVPDGPSNVYRQDLFGPEAGLLDSLAAGRTATLTLVDGTASGALGMGLRGSSRALAAARQACRMP